MAKLLGLAGLIAAALIVPATAAKKTAKMSYGDCHKRVMQDTRYQHGADRYYCSTTCHAAIRRCMASGGKFD